MLSTCSCNGDDLDTSHGFAGIKVVICNPSGEASVKSAIDNESQRVIKNISLKNWNCCEWAVSTQTHRS